MKIDVATSLLEFNNSIVLLDPLILTAPKPVPVVVSEAPTMAPCEIDAAPL